MNVNNRANFCFIKDETWNGANPRGAGLLLVDDNDNLHRGRFTVCRHNLVHSIIRSSEQPSGVGSSTCMLILILQKLEFGEEGSIGTVIEIKTESCFQNLCADIIPSALSGTPQVTQLFCFTKGEKPPKSISQERRLTTLKSPK